MPDLFPFAFPCPLFPPFSLPSLPPPLAFLPSATWRRNAISQPTEAQQIETLTARVIELEREKADAGTLQATEKEGRIVAERNVKELEGLLRGASVILGRAGLGAAAEGGEKGKGEKEQQK